MFWGVMTGRLTTGVVLAILLEAPRWVRTRWDFHDAACGRAWQLSSLAIVLATVMIWLDGNRYTALSNLLTWLPPLLLPMQFVQAYGMRDSIPLATFSFLAKQRRQRNLRLGLPNEERHVNFGNVYLVGVLVAATLGEMASVYDSAFLVGLTLLAGWALVARTGSRPLAVAPALVAAGILTLAGQRGLDRMTEWISSGGGGGREARFDPKTAVTQIGRPGRIQQSPEIAWRLSAVERSPVPRLLRTATYNHYNAGVWENPRMTSKDFEDLTSVQATLTDAYWVAAREADPKAISPKLPRFSLRGGATAEAPLPLPGDVASMRDFQLDGIERGSLGTIRVFPKDSVIEGMVLWKGETTPDAPPVAGEDVQVSRYELTTLDEVAAEIGLSDSLELPKKLELVRKWFSANFRYTRSPRIFSPTYVRSTPTGISQFLTKNREGHCEYFATAAALLLRQTGVPTRYATGFAVMERDSKRNEFVIRGTHGHAWCRVWDDRRSVWMDFDPTPPGSLLDSQPQRTRAQDFYDAVKRVREDFFLWRNQPDNRLVVSLVMGAVALAVAAFIGRRLWLSRRRLDQAGRVESYQGPVVRTPLHDLEPRLRPHLGPRAPGMTLPEWLAVLRPRLRDAAVLDEALEIHQRLRFDPEPAAEREHERLAELAGGLTAQLKKMKRPPAESQRGGSGVPSGNSKVL